MTPSTWSNPASARPSTKAQDPDGYKAVSSQEGEELSARPSADTVAWAPGEALATLMERAHLGSLANQRALALYTIS